MYSRALYRRRALLPRLQRLNPLRQLEFAGVAQAFGSKQAESKSLVGTQVLGL